MPFLICEIIEGIISANLMTYNVSRMSTNNPIFLNPLQISEIQNTDHAHPNKTYLID